jgi:hypothetical protein
VNRAANIQTQWRDDPSVSRAEKLHQLDKDPNNRRAGQAVVNVNMRTILGGFAAFRKATETQKATAIRFKNAHDNGQVGGTRAQDYGKEYVDGGGVNPELAFIIGDKARKDWLFAQSILGIDFLLLEAVIIHERTATDLAKRLPARFGDKKRTAERNASQAIYSALDRLAEGWGLSTIEVRD